MTIFGIAALFAALSLTLIQPPRTKRKRKQRRQFAIALAVVGIGLIGAPLIEQATAPAPTTPTTGDKTSSAQPVATLAQMTYHQTQEITVNNNDPGFTASELSTKNGAWTRFSDLDAQNRAGTANAMLNRSLMPTEPRTQLTWKPTGWHNKHLKTGWLYNRSHLIGFQLSGENNNPKNLITGTRSLNSPMMVAHELDIAAYLKSDDTHYVRYEVTPIFRGDELLARGVAMRAQSIGDDTIRFNVYIFNVEDGVTLNYADGTSRVTN